MCRAVDAWSLDENDFAVYVSHIMRSAYLDMYVYEHCMRHLLYTRYSKFSKFQSEYIYLCHNLPRLKTFLFYTLNSVPRDAGGELLYYCVVRSLHITKCSSDVSVSPRIAVHTRP